MSKRINDVRAAQIPILKKNERLKIGQEVR
jgi:hypothetical protein